MTTSSKGAKIVNIKDGSPFIIEKDESSLASVKMISATLKNCLKHDIDLSKAILIVPDQPKLKGHQVIPANPQKLDPQELCEILIDCAEKYIPRGHDDPQ